MSICPSQTTETRPHSATGLAPVSVLLGHNTRTATLPIPRAPPTAMEIKASTQGTRHQQQVKAAHDRHAKELPPLKVGDKVWFTEFRGHKERWSQGSIVATQHPHGRSYEVKAAAGGTYGRNRVYLRPDTTKPPKHPDDDEDDTYDLEVYESTFTSPGIANSPDITRRAQGGNGFVPPTATRSGRAIKPARS